MSKTPARVLIVDDQLANIQVLVEAIGRGYDIRFATDGERALALAIDEPPDLVLLDVVMPGTDGFEVLRGAHAQCAGDLRHCDGRYRR